MSDFVTGAIRWWARNEPGTIALQLDDDQVSYGDLDLWADRVAHDIVDRLGVEPGDRVGVIGVNSLEWIVAALATMRTGAILTPFNHRLKPREMAGLLADCSPKAVFTSSSHTELMVESVGSMDIALPKVEDLAQLRSGPARPFECPYMAPDSVAAILYTSGTTATPKGVTFTRQSLVLNLLEWSLMEPGFRHGMQILLALPLSAVPGIIWGVTHAMLHAGTLHVMRDYDPDRAIELIEKRRIGVLSAVPFIYEAMVGRPGFADADFSHFTSCVVGGARVSPETLKAWHAKGAIVRQVYGLTEGGGPISVMPHQQALESPHLAGRGAIFTKIRVVNPDGGLCAPDEVGEVHVQGPAVTPGYWQNQEATDAFIKDHWIHTGDLARVDDEGNITIVGRLKDMIISGGINIAPSEIENVLVELSEIEEVAVIGVADPKFGETPAAIVRLKAPMTAEAIIAHCDERLSNYKVPRYIVFIDDPLPRLASGKVAKPELRTTYADVPTTHPKVR